MITICLKKSEVEFAKRFGREAEIGGRSQVRPNTAQRKGYLSEDQVCGQLCELALHKYWYGHIVEYARFRWFKNQVRTSGDKGVDIVPFNVDIKGSMIRSTARELTEYRLAVRPNERHKDWIYISALCMLNGDGSAFVYLMGWETDDNLPREPDREGVFAGAYTISNLKLKPLMPLRTLWLM